MKSNKNNNKERVPAIIFSGGSEIVSIGIAEELAFYNIPFIVIALGKTSLLKDATLKENYFEIDWPPVNVEKTLEKVIAILIKIGAGKPVPWPIFATEDGGLRFIYESKKVLSPYIVAGGASKLSMGGLCKAELFKYLENNNCSQYIPFTKIVDSPEQALLEIKNTAFDVIIKPSLKPLSMSFAGMDSKIITIDKKESRQSIEKQLISAWSLSEKWILQEKLPTIQTGEPLWWGGKWSNNKISGLTATQIWNYPVTGGSGAWVQSQNISKLPEIGKIIADTINMKGCMEIPFLLSTDMKPLLLELNPRPWLQITLAHKSGFPLVYATYQTLLNMEIIDFPVFAKEDKNWVNVERVLLGVAKRSYGSLFPSLYKTAKIIKNADYLAGYSCKLKGVRRRWIQRMSVNLLKTN